MHYTDYQKVVRFATAADLFLGGKEQEALEGIHDFQREQEYPLLEADDLDRYLMQMENEAFKEMGWTPPNDLTISTFVRGEFVQNPNRTKGFRSSRIIVVDLT